MGIYRLESKEYTFKSWESSNCHSDCRVLSFANRTVDQGASVLHYSI